VRVNGRRRYDGSAVQRLCVIERAQRAGFTLGEIRELIFGFAAGTHPRERREALARRKLAELEEQRRRIDAIERLLREGLCCGCLTIEQCTVWLSGLEPAPAGGWGNGCGADQHSAPMSVSTIGRGMAHGQWRRLHRE
jgi:MerR, DNA binding